MTPRSAASTSCSSFHTGGIVTDAHSAVHPGITLRPVARDVRSRRVEDRPRRRRNRVLSVHPPAGAAVGRRAGRHRQRAAEPAPGPGGSASAGALSPRSATPRAPSCRPPPARSPASGSPHKVDEVSRPRQRGDCPGDLSRPLLEGRSGRSRRAGSSARRRRGARGLIGHRRADRVLAALQQARRNGEPAVRAPHDLVDEELAVVVARRLRRGPCTARRRSARPRGRRSPCRPSRRAGSG